MRLLYIDNLRGLAILLVVFGHIIQYVICPDSFDNNHLFRFIYSFHMPLFFIISGLTVSIEAVTKEVAIQKIKRRLIQLLCPFVAWYVITKLLLGELPSYELFIYPDSGLWFLWALFWCAFNFYLSMMISHYTQLPPVFILLITFLVLFLFAVFVSGLFGMGMISYYFLFYVIGGVLGRFREIIPCIKYRYHIFIVFLAVSVLLSLLWHRDAIIIPVDEPRWICQINQSRLFRVLTALVGSVWVILLSTFTTIMGGVGKKTLGIYAIHQVMLWITPISFFDKLHFMNDGLLFVLSVVMVMSLTLLVYDLLSYRKITKVVLLGKYK